MSSSAQPTHQYTQGYHDSVTKSHASRTAEADAAFLLPHLRPDMHILDVGCGPGTITAGFTRYVPSGSVTGVDISDVVISQARSHAASQNLSNITFTTADILSDKGLPFADATFDVIYCHQFLIHLPDPIAALREMKRVCKSPGMVTCREGDMPWKWYPETEVLNLWTKLMLDMVYRDRERFSGHHLHMLARKAGFNPDLMQKSGSMTIYSSKEERAWWGNLHAERIEKSDVGMHFREIGATEEQLVMAAKALRDWAEDVDGWYGLNQCEIICRT